MRKYHIALDMTPSHNDNAVDYHQIVMGLATKTFYPTEGENAAYGINTMAFKEGQHTKPADIVPAGENATAQDKTVLVVLLAVAGVVIVGVLGFICFRASKNKEEKTLDPYSNTADNDQLIN